MNTKLPNDVKMIELPEDRVIGKITIKSRFSLPVLMGSEIDLKSISGGLIKIIAWVPEIDGIEYYKDLLLSLNPGIADRLNLAGVAKSEKGDLKFAEELFLALNHLTNYQESYLNLCKVYSKIKKKALEEDDDTLSEEMDEKVYHCLLDCTEKYPNFAAGFNELSKYHLEQGNQEEARNTLTRFLELTDDKEEKEKFGKILKQLDKEAEQKNDIMYAYDKIMMDCPEEAIETLNKVIAEDGKSWESFFFRGWAKRILNQFDMAEEDLMKGLSLNRTSPEIYNELSICARELGKAALGKSYLEIALDLDPDNFIYLANLAFLHLEDKEYSSAAPLLVKANKLKNDDVQLLQLIKEFEEKSGLKIDETFSEEIVPKEVIENIKKKNPQIKEV